MSRFILPFLLLAVSIGLFVAFTGPTYQQIQMLQGQQAQYNDALNKAQQLHGLTQQLLAKRNTFLQSNLDELQNILPDNVDNIRLIIDTNNIASRHGLSISNLQLSAPLNGTTNTSAAAVGSTGSPIGSVELGFSVTTNYNTFLAFLQDLEQSERIVDIDHITFKSDPNDHSVYDISFRTYWLH